MKRTRYLSTNAKLKQDGIVSWGIPAYRAADGRPTCPAAVACVAGCYARQGRYVMTPVKSAQEARLALALSDSFVDTLTAEIAAIRNARAVRVHDSGDFFSAAYRDKWFQIARNHPTVRFYAYTKMVPLFRNVEVPPNFRIIFSFGGLYDSQIDRDRDAHSWVFDSVEALQAAGYEDAHEVDAPAAFGSGLRIGLVYHGWKSRAWSGSTL